MPCCPKAVGLKVGTKSPFWGTRGNHSYNLKRHLKISTLSHSRVISPPAACHMGPPCEGSQSQVKRWAVWDADRTNKGPALTHRHSFSPWPSTSAQGPGHLGWLSHACRPLCGGALRLQEVQLLTWAPSYFRQKALAPCSDPLPIVLGTLSNCLKAHTRILTGYLLIGFSNAWISL